MEDFSEMFDKPVYNHAVDLDQKTLEQFKNCTECDFVRRAALMPDAHLGYVAPVGAVLITKEFLVPAWVGYDIGCGMTAVRLENVNVEDVRKNAVAIHEAVETYVPMGVGEINGYKDITNHTQREYDSLLNTFKQKPYNNNIYQFFSGSAIRHLGSLGSGNHFIELNEGKDGDAWLVVHSGSRGVGYKVAKRYMKRVAGTSKEYEETHPISDQTQLGKEYANILEFGLEFALLNRMEMIYKCAYALEEVLKQGVDFEVWVNKNHNHAIPKGDEYVHRKGATPAAKGERGVIPANMRDGSYLVVGKGAPAFLESSSHGAGRILSRTDARDKISVEAFEKEMTGVVGTIGEKTLDEAPQAYKDISRVMDAQRDSIEVVNHLTPIINWKGG